MGRGGGMMAEADGDDDDDMSGGMMGMMGMMGRGGGMMGHGHMILRKLDRLAEQLNLAEEQQTQIRSLARTHLKEAIQTRAAIATQRIDLIALLDAESVDLPEVKETLQSLASQQADLIFAHVTLMDEINQLLTPEQQQQFRTMRRQMMHGGGMMGVMGGGMHGQGHMMGQGGMRGQSGRRE
jgi:Spy/CpxP family protein refolding chaperone